MLVGRFVYGSGAVSSVLWLKRHTYTYEMPRDESVIGRGHRTRIVHMVMVVYMMFPYVRYEMTKEASDILYIYMVRKHNLPKAVRTVWPSLLSDSCCC